MDFRPIAIVYLHLFLSSFKSLFSNFVPVELLVSPIKSPSYSNIWKLIINVKYFSSGYIMIKLKYDLIKENEKYVKEALVVINWKLQTLLLKI